MRLNLKKIFFNIFLLSLILLIVSCCAVLAASVEIEPENGEIISNYRVVESDTASGGAYVEALESGNLSAKNVADLGEHDEIIIKFNIPEDGSYTYFARYSRKSGSSSSVFCVIDGMFYKYTFSDTSPDWKWKKGLTLNLKKGEHTIKLYARLHSTRIDKFIFTTDVTFQPEGMGNPPDVDRKVYENGSGYLLHKLPSTVPQNEHPRLMIRKDEINSLREKVTHPDNIKTYEETKKLADSDTNIQTSGYNPIAISVIESRAFMYLATGDSEYGKLAADSTMAHLRSIDLGSNPGTAAQRNAGHVIFVLSCAYDWCYDFFTPEQRQEFITLCKEKLLDLFENGYPPIEKSGIMHLSSHFTENPYLKDLLAYSIAVYDEDPTIYNINVGMILESFIPVRNYRIPGEFNFDGSTYGQFRLYCDFYCMYMLSKIGMEHVFDSNFKMMPYQFVYMTRPDGNFMMDGDYAGPVFNMRNKMRAIPYAMLASSYYNDGFLKQFYYKKIGSQSYGADGQNDLSLAQYLIINEPELKPEDYSSLPLTKYFGSPAGVMIARTGWDEGKDSNTAICMMKMNEHFWGSHQHYDVGAFQFYYKGMLALDSGIYESLPYIDENGNQVAASAYGSLHDTYYHKATIAHNCLIVEDPSEPFSLGTAQGGQRMLKNSYAGASTFNDFLSDEYKTGEIIAYDYGPDMHSPEYSYFEGDISYAYSDKITDYTRAFMFLNLFDDEIPAALIVYDRVNTKKASFKKSWLLHSVEEPEVSGNEITIRRTEIHNNGKMVNQTLLPENAVLTVVGGEGQEYLSGGTNYYIKKQEVGDESGSWRVEISPKEEQKQDYFLNVMQVSENNDEIVPLKASYKNLGDYLGVYIKDRAVFLKKDQGKNYKSITVSAEGDGLISYIVANLSEGLWKIYDEKGKLVTASLINGENGVAYFKAQAGKYTLEWNFDALIPKKDFNILNSVKPVEYPTVSLFYSNQYYGGKAFLKDNEVMVSLKSFVNNFPEKLSYEKDGATEKISYGANIIEFTEGNTCVCNGVKIEMDYPSIYSKNELYVPLKAIMEAFELEYSFDKLTNIVYINGDVNFVVEGADPRIRNYADADIAKVLNVTWDGEATFDGFRTVDGDLSTNYASQIYGSSVKWELDKVYKLDKFIISWYLGSVRKQKYAFYVSEDNINWTLVSEGESSGKTAQFEDLPLDNTVNAKYVKFVGYYNSASEFNCLNEIKFHCVE